jgi:hypothetical protein
MSEVVEVVLPLTQQEQEMLHNMERKIDDRSGTIVEAFGLLKTIERYNLYRDRASTFREYVEKRFPDIYEVTINDMASLSPQRRYQIRQAEGVLTSLIQQGVTDLPMNEIQLRALAKSKPETRAEIWEQVKQEAEESGKKITHERIQQKAMQVIGLEAKVQSSLPLEERSKGRWTVTVVPDTLVIYYKDRYVAFDASYPPIPGKFSGKITKGIRMGFEELERLGFQIPTQSVYQKHLQQQVAMNIEAVEKSTRFEEELT